MKQMMTAFLLAMFFCNFLQVPLGRTSSFTEEGLENMQEDNTESTTRTCGDENTPAPAWLFGMPDGEGPIWAQLEVRGSTTTHLTVEFFNRKGELLDDAQDVELATGNSHFIATRNGGGKLDPATHRVLIRADRPIVVTETAGTVEGDWTTSVPGVRFENGCTDFAELAGAKAQGASSCCGYSSSSNPYPCACSSKPSTGNCTWWAWKKAKDEWGKSLPSWGNAMYWASKAKSAGYPVKSTAASKTIGCNTWVAGYGHVAWVQSVSGSNVSMSEMNYCSTCKKDKTYPASWFDGGYIYKK